MQCCLTFTTLFGHISWFLGSRFCRSIFEMTRLRHESQQQSSGCASVCLFNGCNAVLSRSHGWLSYAYCSPQHRAPHVAPRDLNLVFCQQPVTSKGLLQVFLKHLKTIVRHNKPLFTRHNAAKLADFAKHSPTKFWKHFRQEGKSLPAVDMDKWMAHFDRL